MKWLILPALLTSCLICVATQQPQHVPFKGADTILITTQESGPTALVKLAEVEKARGYLVDTLTDVLLVTTPRLYEFNRDGIITPAQHRFRATMQGDNIIRLIGVFRLQLNNTHSFESAMGWYGSGDVSQNKACFSQAQAIALAYPGGRISYAKRP